MSSETLILLAYMLAHQYGCALYDALYLSLAEIRGVPLITADNDFYRKVSDLPGILWIGDYSSASTSG